MKLGGTSWKWQVKPVGNSCTMVNLISANRADTTAFLTVSSNCKTFAWGAKDSSRARFMLVRKFV